MEDYLQKLNRKVITVNTLKKDTKAETRFWLSKPPVERLIALELLRSRRKNYDSTTTRLQRFYTVTERV